MRILCATLRRLAGILFLLALPAAEAASSLTSDSVAAAARYSAEHGGAALLIRQDGKTVLAAGQIRSSHKIYSGTKGFWILAALIGWMNPRPRLCPNGATIHAKPASRSRNCSVSPPASTRNFISIPPACPIAKVATGTPAGICTIESNESTPFSTRLSTGTPSTGNTVCAAWNLGLA